MLCFDFHLESEIFISDVLAEHETQIHSFIHFALYPKFFFKIIKHVLKPQVVF